MNEQDYCIVNIWTSEKNKVIEGTDWGHVSLETNLGYYSLWPAPRTEEERAAYRRALNAASDKEYRAMTGKTAKFFNTRPQHLMENLDADIAAKGEHEPEARIAFYSLNPGDINQYFINILLPSLDKAGGWRLIGSNTLSRIGNSPESCSSLIYRLLLAGGLQKLVKVFDMSTIGSQNSSAVKPDKFLEQVLLAKSTELKKYTITRNFRFEGQSDVEALIERHQLAGKKNHVPNDNNSSSSFRWSM